MNILILGSGGREHALAWKLRQSPRVKQLYVAPGNAGTATLATNVPLDIIDHQAVISFAKANSVDLVVIGPDEPLARGVVDDVQAVGIRVFGPTKAAAEIEWSKAFAKQFMQEEGIPTAQFGVFTDRDEAAAYLKKQTLPIVIKASGLAAGKGVIIAEDMDEGLTALDDMMSKDAFGEAGREVVIEEYLEGPEISVHAFCDGETAILFPSSQDHKRVYDGDEGSNTGGMGTIAPIPWVTEELMKDIRENIVLPTLRGLARRERMFRGVLFPGIIVTKDGPKVLEFNARFGDPETQSYVRLLKTDLVDILLACADGTLKDLNIEWKQGSACCVVAASGGYPGEYEIGIPIHGLHDDGSGDTVVFHAGTKMDDDMVVTNGGRVLGVTAVAPTLRKALEKAYKKMDGITFDKMHVRRDIGRKTLTTQRPNL